MIKKAWLSAVIYRAACDSREVTWTWKRLKEKTKIEWQAPK